MKVTARLGDLSVIERAGEASDLDRSALLKVRVRDTGASALDRSGLT